MLSLRSRLLIHSVSCYFLISLLISCDQSENEPPTDVFDVTVQGIDCGLVVIDFKEIDLNRIALITDSESQRFLAYKLDRNQFAIAGTSLSVRVRKVLDSEIGICNTLGPSFPWVTIVEVL